MKQNLIEGKGSSQFSWKFNMDTLVNNVKKDHRCDLSKWSESYGLYPGRAFILFAEYSRWIFLNTNTIPFLKFFPRMVGTFPSNGFNFVLTPDSPLSMIKYNNTHF
jgi:hypothetical protein